MEAENAEYYEDDLYDYEARRRDYDYGADCYPDYYRDQEEHSSEETHHEAETPLLKGCAAEHRPMLWVRRRTMPSQLAPVHKILLSGHKGGKGRSRTPILLGREGAFLRIIPMPRTVEPQ